MKRIYYFLMLGLSLVLVQCQGDKKQETTAFAEQKDEIRLYKANEIPYEENKGYILKNQLHNNGVQHVKITSKAQFSTLFDPNTALKELKEIDFSKSFVLALVGIPSKLETAFSIKSVKEKQDSIELMYCLEEEEIELTKAIYPYTILVLDKKFNKDVHFLIE
ncbi:hypothetical protein [Myroides odoratus]|uniref:hypothetical protein n=1 Tax=Myroides odoratus TaxID=256 RepID=UPI0039AF87B1